MRGVEFDTVGAGFLDATGRGDELPLQFLDLRDGQSAAPGRHGAGSSRVKSNAGCTDGRGKEIFLILQKERIRLQKRIGKLHQFSADRQHDVPVMRDRIAQFHQAPDGLQERDVLASSMVDLNENLASIRMDLFDTLSKRFDVRVFGHGDLERKADTVGLVHANDTGDDEADAVFGAGIVVVDPALPDFAVRFRDVNAHRDHDDPVGDLDIADLPGCKQFFVFHALTPFHFVFFACFMSFL